MDPSDSRQLLLDKFRLRRIACLGSLQPLMLIQIRLLSPGTAVPWSPLYPGGFEAGHPFCLGLPWSLLDSLTQVKERERFKEGQIYSSIFSGVEMGAREKRKKLAKVNYLLGFSVSVVVEPDRE
uniref:Uncharacterized protein n=1 Tax=Timema tahoe TaxID=61484 RepID=A0A7R9IL37_9NEOP|nr:unnamed protein product [Timema tahoe]